MVLDIILITLGVVCLLTGLIGSILPVLPGPPLSYVGLILIHLSDYVQYTTEQLVLWFILMLLTIIFDYMMPVWGVKKWNGSKWGNRGCIVGTLVGLFFFPPWGLVIGAFAGAFIGEVILGKRQIKDALKSGFGAFIGFLLGTVFKIGVCGWFIYCFIAEMIFPPA